MQHEQPHLGAVLGAVGLLPGGHPTQQVDLAWDKIKEQLANLKDKVIGGIIDFVVDRLGV